MPTPRETKQQVIEELRERIGELRSELALEQSRRLLSESYELLYARELMSYLLSEIETLRAERGD